LYDNVLKRYVPPYFSQFKAIDYEEIIREILKVLIKNSKGIEINTSGFRRGLEETLPTREVLEWYRELGGEILTIGSDAHYVKHLGNGLDKGMNPIKNQILCSVKIPHALFDINGVLLILNLFLLSA